MRTTMIALVAAGALALPAAAQAHVTVNPKQEPAGGYAKLDVRVPNEEDAANTTKVQLKLPPGFVSASYAAEPGWTVKVTTRKLAKPIATADGPVSEEVDQITWTATGAGVRPGQFIDFPLSVKIPGKAGDTLTFKALQTYSNGEIVRWIGPEGSEHPAPTLAVTAPAADPGSGASDAGSSSAGTSQPAATVSGDTGASKGLGIAALVIAILALLTGGAALLRGRRTTA